MNTSVTTNSTELEAAPKAAYEKWRKIVEAELKGAPFDKKLVTRTPEGISVQPVYTRLDATAPYSFKARSYVEAPWDFAQEVGASSPEEFNRRVLADLGKGLNSLAIDFTGDVGGSLGIDGVAGLKTALAGVEIGCIPVYLRTGASASSLGAALASVADSRGIPFSAIKGCVAADPLAELARTGVLGASTESLYDDLAVWTAWTQTKNPELGTVSVDASVWLESGGNAVQELALALAAASEYLHELSSRGVAADVIARKIRFRFSVGGQFFKEIAKFRALRPLWAKLLSGYGLNADAIGLKVDARTTRSNKTLLDPHVNMLRVTTEAASAVLGGVDALTISTYDEVAGGADDFPRRIARNLHTLLAEEFQLTAPADPSRGSWYVEKLTEELGRAAWALFQEIEKKGGLRKNLESGYVQSLIAKSAKETVESYDSRRQILVGTNMYPNIKDQLVAAKAAKPGPAVPAASPAVGSVQKLGTLKARFEALLAGAANSLSFVDLFASLHPAAGASAPVAKVASQRWAAGFEALRSRTQRHLETTKRRPKVYLAKIGTPLQYKARGDFAAGFFGVAGFDIAAKDVWPTAAEAAAAAIASGAEVTVLCSTDETYPELVPVFAGALKKEKASTVVVLAGYPTEHVARFKELGVDEFIHVRANVRETLERILNNTGVSV